MHIWSRVDFTGQLLKECFLVQCSLKKKKILGILQDLLLIYSNCQVTLCIHVYTHKLYYVPDTVNSALKVRFSCPGWSELGKRYPWGSYVSLYSLEWCIDYNLV